MIKEKYPTIKFTSGLSNISYGMPYRKAVNRVFLTMALSAGMNSAIIDPTTGNCERLYSLPGQRWAMTGSAAGTTRPTAQASSAQETDNRDFACAGLFCLRQHGLIFQVAC